MKRLVIRPGAIGDAVVSLPAMAVLKPAEIWCPAQNIPLFERLATARSLVAEGLDALNLSIQTLARLSEFDEIVSWYGTAREDFRRQVQGLPFRFLQALPAEGCALHATDFYLQQVGGAAGAAPRIPVSNRDPHGAAVIHPFSGSRKKNWPLAQFQAVARALQKDMDVRWCAGPAEELAGADRFESLRDLMPWLAGARVFIGNDSGISHLAAACGVPVVAVFGPSDPRVWAPRGRVRVLRFEDTAEAVTSAARTLRR